MIMPSLFRDTSTVHIQLTASNVHDAQVTKGGRVMSFRALVVVGNAKGSGGFGVGKAMLVSAMIMNLLAQPTYEYEHAPSLLELALAFLPQPPDAVARAIRDAKKNLVVVDRYKVGFGVSQQPASYIFNLLYLAEISDGPQNTGLVHSVEGRHNSCKVRNATTVLPIASLNGSSSLLLVCLLLLVSLAGRFARRSSGLWHEGRAHRQGHLKAIRHRRLHSEGSGATQAIWCCACDFQGLGSP
jgi:ribosomal protein S5